MNYAIETSIGKKYTRMEDAFVLPVPNDKYDVPQPDTERKGYLFVISDGMGGARSGDVAAELVANWLFREYYTSEIDPSRVNSILSDQIKLVNQKIYALAKEHDQYEGMGATLLVAVFIDHKVFVSSVGDSRLYLFRKGELKQITEDQSEVWQLYKAGEISKNEIRLHPRNNVVTAAIGQEEDVSINQYEIDIEPDDLFLLCTDGLTDMVPEPEITHILSKSKSLRRVAKALIKKANKYGGKDNITALLIRPL